MRHLRYFLIVVLLMFILVVPVDGGSVTRKVLAVPYVSQGGRPICVSAATTMILQYWGTVATLEDVLGKIGYPPIKLGRIQRAVESYGLTFRYEPNSSIEKLKNWIDDGIPVMVHQVDSEGVREGHMRVVIGYDDARKVLITHDSAHGAYFEISYERFMTLWEELVKYVYPDNPYNEAFVFMPHVRTSTITLDISPDQILVLSYAIMSPVTMTIDGVSYPSSIMPLVLALPKGSTRVVKVESLVQNAQIRYVFDKWNDGNQSATRAIVFAEQSVSFVASYKIQYFLKVTSLFGNPTGQGWYDKDATAKLSVSPLVDLGNGTKWVFLGWTGDLTSPEASVTIVMENSHTVIAKWEMQSEQSITTSTSSPTSVIVSNLGMSTWIYLAMIVVAATGLIMILLARKPGERRIARERLTISASSCSRERCIPMLLVRPLRRC
jgi:hypothetical protein